MMRPPNISLQWTGFAGRRPKTFGSIKTVGPERDE